MAITDPRTEEVAAENAALKAKLAEQERQIQALMNGGVALDEAGQKWVGEMPQYKLIKPFYGPNDVFYDPEGGDEIIEWTGIPNEAMEPLNEPAKKRMEAWLNSMPGGKQPQLGDIAQAAMMIRPRYGDVDPPFAEFQAAVTKLARELMRKREGLPAEETTVRLPQKVDDIPLMGNSQGARKKITDAVKAVPAPPRKGASARKRIMGNTVETPTLGN